jgi:hypothetical protein
MRVPDRCRFQSPDIRCVCCHRAHPTCRSALWPPWRPSSFWRVVRRPNGWGWQHSQPRLPGAVPYAHQVTQAASRLLLLLRHYRHLCHGQMDARYLRLPDHVDRFQRPANRNALDSSLFRFPPRADEQVNECGIWIPIHGDGSELLVVDLTSLVTHRNSTQTGRDGLAY